jgi:hypothetical protein
MKKLLLVLSLPLFLSATIAEARHGRGPGWGGPGHGGPGYGGPGYGGPGYGGPGHGGPGYGGPGYGGPGYGGPGYGGPGHGGPGYGGPGYGGPGYGHPPRPRGKWTLTGQFVKGSYITDNTAVVGTDCYYPGQVAWNFDNRKYSFELRCQ